MTEAKTIPFERQDLVRLGIAAQRIAESANVAYWMHGDPAGAAYHLDEIAYHAAELEAWVALLQSTHAHFAKQVARA